MAAKKNSDGDFSRNWIVWNKKSKRSSCYSIYFCVLIFSLLFIGCKREKNQLNLVGDWYVCQYWGEEERKETDVYESESGNIRNIEHPEKTQIKNWNNSYDYGRNIFSFKEDKSMSSNIEDFDFEGYNNYILDIENKKLIFINQYNKVIYDLLEKTDAIVLSREYSRTYESGRTDYEDWALGERGITYQKIDYNTTINMKLKKIN